MHWLQLPTRFLCSQVFLTPLHTNKFSDNFLPLPDAPHSNSSTCSERNSMDTSSLNSFSLSVSVCVSDNLSALGDDGKSSNNTNPLDMPAPQTTASVSDCVSSSDGLQTSSIAYSDSGYGGTDPWTNMSCSSYCRYSSTRSSAGSMYSERENRRKYSVDSSIADAAAGLLNADGVRSDGNLQRRILRNVSTSFENRLSSSDFIGYFDDNSSVQQHVVAAHTATGSDGCVVRHRRCSEQIESRSNPEMFRRRAVAAAAAIASGGYPPKARSSNRRAKLGLAICITLSDTVEEDMQRYCSEHISLVESMLCRLRANVETAYVNKKNFYEVSENT